jgi:hypothetical protein
MNERLSQVRVLEEGKRLRATYLPVLPQIPTCSPGFMESEMSFSTELPCGLAVVS